MPSRPLALLILAAACSHGKTPGTVKQGDTCSATTDCVSGLTCSAQKCSPPTRHYTFRAIAGISMGAGGSSRLVVQHPEKFDAAGFMGGPLDAPLLAKNLEHAFLEGFCPADKLEAAAALDAQDGGNRLDRPDGIDGCTQANPDPLTHYSRSQRFNHWWFTTNGGTFDRGAHLDIFGDLTLGMGNPLNMPLTQDQIASATCAQPAVVPHVYDATYSPHGEHSAITFCDGDAPVVLCGDNTVVDWCAAAALNGRQLAQSSDADAFCATHGGDAHGADPNSQDTASANAAWAHMGELPGCWAGTRKVPFALAIDINGNGRRDYHEPLLVQMHEPFQDVGKDGCDDAHEDGKGGCVTDPAQSPFAKGTKDPNGDNYDPLKNPTGTEGNYLWEPGEPFDDVGLDGVAGTGDEGEGDGKFTISAGLKSWYDGDLHLHMPPGVDIYSEGGIRDLFDLGAMAEQVAGASAANGPVSSFLDFPSLPPARGTTWPAGFDAQVMDPTVLTPRFFMAYGNPNATLAAIRAGDGDHVGTTDELVDRSLVFFRWLSRRWDPMLPPGSRGVAPPADLLHYQSTVLNADLDYAVSLPPKYDDPANATRRYPVLYMLHGYGQSAEDMSGTGFVNNVLSNLGLIHDMIVVYPSGRCCLDGPNGQRTCNDASAGQGWARECARGSFYLDRPGAAYSQAVWELMDRIDANYRTLSPADGPAF